MDPATMTRLRLFVSVSYAARMSDLNRTTLAKICKEGGGILNGVFYRFTTDEPNCSQIGQQNEIKRSGPTSTSKDLISRIEKEWASKEAKIEAAQAGRALALTKEQIRPKEQEAQSLHFSDRTEGNAPADGHVAKFGHYYRCGPGNCLFRPGCHRRRSRQRRRQFSQPRWKFVRWK